MHPGNFASTPVGFLLYCLFLSVSIRVCICVCILSVTAYGVTPTSCQSRMGLTWPLGFQISLAFGLDPCIMGQKTSLFGSKVLVFSSESSFSFVGWGPFKFPFLLGLPSTFSPLAGGGLSNMYLCFLVCRVLWPPLCWFLCVLVFCVFRSLLC